MTERIRLDLGPVPIVKSYRDDRQGLIFGWANVPEPVEKFVRGSVPDSAEEDINEIAIAYRSQVPDDPDVFRSIVATFSKTIIVEIEGSDPGVKFFEIPYTRDGDDFEFGEPKEVAIDFVAKALAESEDREGFVKRLLSRVGLRKREPKTDLQGDQVPMVELEKAAYRFVLTSREGDVDHDQQVTSQLVESFFVTDEKLELLGVPEEARAEVNKGWWVGFKVDDPTMDRVESGELSMFSIGGSAFSSPTK